VREELFDRPTPLLRFRGALLKLELLRATGGVDDRALPIFPELPRGAGASFAGSGGAALAAASWGRSRGVELSVALEGVVTYEVRKTLELYGTRVVADRATLPRLDGDDAAAAMERTLAREMPGGIRVLVGPAGARAALLACARVLRLERLVALVAADEELPDLPSSATIDGAELRRVTRAECVHARRELARSSGVLATHAAAMAAMVAVEVAGAAIVSASGEREFSLERAS
jgi:cysteine synthase